jgi:hypothetical protein
MIYAFLLFWPANVISPWLMVSLLQFFIPLNLYFKACFSGFQYYRVHFAASFIILLGVGVNMIELKNPSKEHVFYKFNKRSLYIGRLQSVEVFTLLCIMLGDRRHFSCHQGKSGEVTAHESGKVQLQNCSFTIRHRVNDHTLGHMVLCKYHNHVYHRL